MKQKQDIINVLSLVAHGTNLRQALEKTAKAKTGGLIVISEKARKIAEGGFKIDCKFTAQKLAELSKMDGAIIIDSKLKKILYANTLLIPDSKIKSKETGTRHKAAERTAKQLGTIVIAVSEKSSVITVYFGNDSHGLSSIADLLDRARESIQTLERQRKDINKTLVRFNALEPFSLITLEDIAILIQKIELFSRNANPLLDYITELGIHGISLDFRYKETSRGLENELVLLKKDYGRYVDMGKIIKKVELLKQIEINQIIKIIKGLVKTDITLTSTLTPKGYRLLSKLPLTVEDVNKLIRKFGNLKLVCNAKLEQLINVKGIGEKKARLVKDFLIKLADKEMKR